MQVARRPVQVRRGWIMDELEKRDAEAFERWIDCEELELMDLPSRFFIAA